MCVCACTRRHPHSTITISQAAQHLSSFQIPLDHPYHWKYMHAGGKLCVCAVVFFNTSKIYYWTQLERRRIGEVKENRKTYTIQRPKNEFIFQFVSFVVVPLYSAYLLCRARVKYQDYHIFFLEEVHYKWSKCHGFWYICINTCSTPTPIQFSKYMKD